MLHGNASTWDARSNTNKFLALLAPCVVRLFPSCPRASSRQDYWVFSLPRVPYVITQGDLVAMDNVRQANSFSALCRVRPIMNSPSSWEEDREIAMGIKKTQPIMPETILSLRWETSLLILSRGPGG